MNMNINILTLLIYEYQYLFISWLVGQYRESPMFWISIQISTQVQVESLKYLMILIWISIIKKERWVVLQYLMILIWISIIKKERWVVLQYLRTPTTGSLPQCLVVASVRLNLTFHFFSSSYFKIFVYAWAYPVNYIFSLLFLSFQFWT